MALITYDDAVRHLKLQDAEPDQTDVQLKMEMATAIVLEFIDKPTVTATWTLDTTGAPFVIAQGFMFKVLQRIERFRGDDADPKSEFLSQEEQQLLANLLKHPALA